MSARSLPPLPSIESLPVAAEQRLDARAAGDRVVAVAAVEGQAIALAASAGRRDRVVAAEPVDVELCRSAPGARIATVRRQAGRR